MYTVEVGRYRNSYKIRWRFEKENQAILMYRAVNIGYGYKKRLRLNGKTIARYIS